MAFTVEELFKKLSYGELSNLAVAVDASGTIKKERQKQVLHFANEGLTVLHERFPLRELEKMVTMTGAPIEQSMIEEVTPPASPVDYFIQLISVMTAMGESLTFSNKPVPETLYVQGSTVFIPARPAGSELQLIYQARHPVLDDSVLPGNLTQSITLKAELHEALTSWIGYKMYRDIRTAEGQASAADHLTRHKTILADLIGQGILPGEMLTGEKFEARGWV